ncbi:MAG: inorganic phosphate transporter [Parvularculaceae bacterium]
MVTSKASAGGDGVAGVRPKFAPANPLGISAFIAALAGGAFYVWSMLTGDISSAGQILSTSAFIALAVALALALGFEFVNGFHDTANAVATVIYTRSLPPTVAVIWSGLWNFLGVIASAGLVAYSIINLLPVELILQVGSAAGYAMIFALLTSAIAWNVGTWYFGIPNSSSHCLIGSVLGVGLANQLMAPTGYATSGVDWGQAEKVGNSLFISPLIGFTAAAILLLILKFVARNPKLYKAPESDAPPPWWIRATLITTCTAVSFAHGGNDGQKGMGLIMLILIGAAPAAFALNRALPDAEIAAMVSTLEETAAQQRAPTIAGADLVAARATIGEALRAKDVSTPEARAAFAALSSNAAEQLKAAGSLGAIRPDDTGQFRSDIYVIGETAKLISKTSKTLSDAEEAALSGVAKATQNATRFIPDWVKLGVALALGLGTMVGWKRIVITVGEKIGKSHMTYAQGAAAETVAAATILSAQSLGLPVSTTHVLNSAVAGTMAANGSGLQWKTIGTLASAWLFTLPIVITLSGFLYFLGMQVVAAL